MAQCLPRHVVFFLGCIVFGHIVFKLCCLWGGLPLVHVDSLGRLVPDQVVSGVPYLWGILPLGHIVPKADCLRAHCLMADSLGVDCLGTTCPYMISFVVSPSLAYTHSLHSKVSLSPQKTPWLRMICTFLHYQIVQQSTHSELQRKTNYNIYFWRYSWLFREANREKCKG